MKLRACAAIAVFGILTVVWALTAHAELPSPRFDRLVPLGAAAGTSVEVELVGNDLEGANALVFDIAGIKATPVEGKERRFNVSVAAEVPEGTYDARLVGRFGVSSPRLLEKKPLFTWISHPSKLLPLLVLAFNCIRLFSIDVSQSSDDLHSSDQ